MENSDLKLPLDIKEKWVQSLRSGKYPQTFGKLRDRMGYCCLGVLGKVCGYSDFDLSHRGFLYSHSFPNVPEILQNSTAGGFPGILSKMNDQRKSFNEIADWIEQNL